MAKKVTPFHRVLSGATAHWLDDHFEFQFMLHSFDAHQVPDLEKACKKRKWTLITNEVGGSIYCKVITN